MKRYKDIAGDGGSNIAGQVEAQQGRLRRRMASVGAVVAIVSGKGGVGKSALTANLASCLALEGSRSGSSTRISTGRRRPRFSVCAGAGSSSPTAASSRRAASSA